MHWGITSQFGIELWHGQSVAACAVIAMAIVHGFAVAILATGKKAIVSDNKTARIVRCNDMRVSASCYIYLALEPTIFK